MLLLFLIFRDIARYAKEHNTLVLTGDSDFYIFDIPGVVFLDDVIRGRNISVMTHQLILSKLHITEFQLFFLIYLLGNDFSDGNNPDNDFSDGNNPDNDFSDGNNLDNDFSDGNNPDNDFSDGNNPDNDPIQTLEYVQANVPMEPEFTDENYEDVDLTTIRKQYSLVNEVPYPFNMITAEVSEMESFADLGITEGRHGSGK